MDSAILMLKKRLLQLILINYGNEKGCKQTNSRLFILTTLFGGKTANEYTLNVGINRSLQRKEISQKLQ